MAKLRPSRGKKYRQKPVYGKLKSSAKPKWMWVTRLITIILLSILMLMAIAVIMINYYRSLSNHK
jgi:hypothetical protein